MYAENIEIVKVGPLRLFKAILDRIGVIQAINTALNWDESQWKISPGTLIVAMMMGVFCGRRALFSLNRVYARQDLELLFGRNDLSAEDFNDDCLGRALDRLAEADFDKIFGGIVLCAFAEYQLAAETLHADTTSVSVYGDYASQDDDAPFILAKGHSKDHRPDLKQFKYGLATNEDGIPVYGATLDGNQDDKTWSRSFLEYAPNLKRFMTEKTVIAADSAAMSAKSLEAIKQHRLRVVSRLPETFTLCRELTEMAFAQGNWQPSTHTDDVKKNEAYKLQPFRAHLVNDEYSFVVVQSESLAGTKEKTIEKAVVKEAVRLEKALAAFSAKRFSSFAQAEAAWSEEAGKLQPQYHTLTCELRRFEEPLTRPRPGRPRKGEGSSLQTLYGLEGTAARDEERIRRIKDMEGTFVLFCSAPELTPSEILRAYKEQAAIENRFRFLKDPYFVGPVNLKLPHRVQALGYVMLMTLLIYSLFEWSVREGLKRENEPFHVAGSYKTFRPRGETILPELDDLSIFTTQGSEGTLRQLPSNYSRRAERIIRLCGFDISIYVTPPVAAT
ncbi:MAG: IS1634 family transposase [Bacteroidota bacterium]